MKFSLISSLIALLVPLLAYADDEQLPNNDFIVDFVGDETRTIAAILESNPNFSELFKGLNDTLLIRDLAGEGPFTLFAPTDAAVQKFKDYSPGTFEEWQSILGDFIFSEILLHHVFEGAVPSTDIEDGLILEMATGENATLMLNPPMIEDANIILTDVKASNGIIHVIDTIITPPFITVFPGMFYVLKATGEFDMFLELLDNLNLTQSLFSRAFHLIFPPTDEAFMKLGNLTDDDEALLAIVGAHYVELDFSFNGLQDGEVLSALSGNNLTVSVNETGSFMIDDAVVVFPDPLNIVSFNGVSQVMPTRLASNGLIYGIDTVIVPFDLSDPDTDLPDPVFPSASVSHMSSYWAAIVLGLFALLA